MFISHCSQSSVKYLLKKCFSFVNYENASRDLQSNVLLDTLQGHRLQPVVMQNLVSNLIYIILCDQNYVRQFYLYVYFNLRFAGIRIINIV